VIDKIAEGAHISIMETFDDQNQPEKRPVGRPTDYQPEFCEQAATMCANGATDQEIADFFEVHIATIYRWSARHEEFSKALKVGKELADERVERSLYARAVGFEHTAVKIFMPAGTQEPVYAKYREYVPPETGAAALWLKNRRGDRWRDKQQMTHTGPDDGPVEFEHTFTLNIFEGGRSLKPEE
jgi:hypothetical protein